MNPDQLTRYLHHEIPLSAAMAASIRCCNEQRVSLDCPLAPNSNHKGTVFGGSLSTAATLAAWCLLYVRLQSEGLLATVVIQRHEIDYLAPASSAFEARAEAPPEDEWSRFTRTLSRRGKARLDVPAAVYCGELLVARFNGQFVAVAG